MRLAQRLLLAPLGSEAVALDLATGAFYRLAGAAVGIARALAAGHSPREIGARLARDSRIGRERARADVAAVVDGLTADHRASRRPGPRFAPAPGGLDLAWDGRAVLFLDGAGERASLRGTGRAPSPRERLRWALPHLLWMRGVAVLHASAVRLGAGALAITGASGSGKSALARLLAAEAPIAAVPLADDLLVLRAGSAGAEVVLSGEAAARAWEARQAERLEAGEEAELAPADLAAVTAGPALPLRQVWVLDAGRRGGEEIALDPAPGADGLALLLEHSFAESGAPEVWRRIFETAVALLGSAALRRARVPATLPALQAAARRYTAKVAS